MVHSTREQAQESVQDECQDGRGYATDEHRFEVAGLKTTEDVVTQAQTTNRRRESRHADSPGHRRTNPGNDYRQGQWKPHAQQLFSRPHTNRARRVKITADGAAIATATNTATATSHRCSADNLTISASGMRFVGCPLPQGCEERHCLWRWRLHKLIRPGDNFEPPFLQQRDPRAEHECFADVVGDEKRGLAQGSLHSREALLHLKPRHRVERRERDLAAGLRDRA